MDKNVGHDISFEEMQKLIIEALSEVYLKEKYLIDIGSSERSIIHWFAIYFERLIKKQYPQYRKCRADVEYNRYKDDIKHSATKGKACTVDMVFHKRGEQGYNLLCIEAKTPTGENREADRERVSAMMESSDYDCVPQYQYGAFIDILTGSTHKASADFKIMFYSQGRKEPITRQSRCKNKLIEEIEKSDEL